MVYAASTQPVLLGTEEGIQFWYGAVGNFQDTISELVNRALGESPFSNSPIPPSPTLIRELARRLWQLQLSEQERGVALNTFRERCSSKPRVGFEGLWEGGQSA